MTDNEILVEVVKRGLMTKDQADNAAHLKFTELANSCRVLSDADIERMKAALIDRFASGRDDLESFASNINAAFTQLWAQVRAIEVSRLEFAGRQRLESALAPSAVPRELSPQVEQSLQAPQVQACSA